MRHRAGAAVWGAPHEWDVVEAVVKLLRETSAQLEGSEGEGKRPKWLRQLDAGHNLGKEIDKLADERRMLSRFGVWTMAALCPPAPHAPPVSIQGEREETRIVEGDWLHDGNGLPMVRHDGPSPE